MAVTTAALLELPPGRAGLVLAAAIVLVLFLVAHAAVAALWAWRESRVDLVALEEKIQAKRAKDPAHTVGGLTQAEIDERRTDPRTRLDRFR